MERALRAELIATSPYWRVELRDEVKSTQLEFGDDPSEIDAGRVIVAEYQSAGRGRLDRSFVSSRSQGLTFSFLLAPEKFHTSWLPLLIGVATVDAINAMLQERSIEKSFYTKWPNDILTYEGKKLGGILLEKRGKVVIAGIGINVLQDEASLPVAHATSLFLATGEKFAREEVLSRVLQVIKERYFDWQQVGVDQRALDQYISSSLTISREVEVELPSGERIFGLAQSIRSDGALEIFDLNTKAVKVISAGDVVHARGNTQTR